MTPTATVESEIAEAYEWLVKYNANVVAYGSTESNICNGTISAMLTYDGNTAEAMATMGENTPWSSLRSPRIPSSWASTCL